MPGPDLFTLLLYPENEIGGLLTGEILPLVTLGVNLCTVASPPFAPYCVRWLVSVRAVS